MTTKHLGRAAAMGLLLSLAGQLLAQTTTLQTLQGSRHAGPGAVNASSSTFGLGMTRDNGATFVTTAGVSDSVVIRGEVRPEPANIGQTADIFVVDRLLETNEFRMRNPSGVWVPWGATVSTLVPFREDVVLTSAFAVEMFTGTLGTTGSHRIFLGYLPPDGILRYHTSGLPLTITATPTTPTQTPMEQATALFSSKISPNIVQFVCIVCHVDGDPTTAGVHQFVQGSSTSVINTNFNVFRGLMGRGKAYILAKVRGEQNHFGGQVLSPTSQDYKDLEQFLTLLEQI